MATEHFFLDLFNQIDILTVKITTQPIEKITTFVIPMFAAGLIMMMITKAAISIFDQNEPFPLTFWLKKFFSWQLIVAVAGVGGYYSSYFIHDIMTIPDTLADMIVSSISNNKASSSSGTGQMLDTMITHGANLSRKAWNSADVWSSEGWAAMSEAAMFLIATIAFTVIGAAILLCEKVLMAIVLVFGPIAILCLLFDATKGFFERWLNNTVTLGLIVVCEGVVFAVFEKYFDDILVRTLGIGGTATEKGLTALTGGTEILAVGTIGCICLIAAPWLAQHLGGGMMLNVTGMVNSSAGAVSGMLNGGGGQQGGGKQNSSTTGKSSSSGSGSEEQGSDGGSRPYLAYGSRASKMREAANSRKTE